MDYTKFRKALVPVVVAIVLAGLAAVHITGQMTVQQVVTLLVTAGAVYIVPNKS